MDKRSYERLVGTDIFLIVNDRALCKIDKIDFEVGRNFPTSKDNSLIEGNVTGTIKLYELNSNYYDKSFNNSIVIDTEEEGQKYTMIIYNVVISADRLEGYADYTFKATAIRIVRVK